MSSVLQGLIEFADAWESIATELLATKEQWNFSKAPKGGAAKLVSIEFAALFVTVANRAMGKAGLFERRPFVVAYAKAELKPHKRTLNSLTNSERDKQRRRILSSVAADMAVMVEYGLFEKTNKDYVYRITKKGEEIYELLSSQSNKSSNASDNHLPSQHPRRRPRAAGGRNSKIVPKKPGELARLRFYSTTPSGTA